MFVNGIIEKTPTKISCFMEIHLVNKLKTNLLIKNDIFKFQNVSSITTRIFLYSVYIKISLQQSTFAATFFNIKRTIKIKSAVIVLPFTTIRVPVMFKSFIPNDRDFLFKPECH